ncbi:FHA domain-containing protein FhaB/FipA [Propionicicella superfundia]|uniref:FHA domain-containing protein FhaB/FipA n=1 Tax=Propionicicella superfundia TaxID=348582 RepID=UPI000402D1FF|nr:FHA domain-containing protein [Propionicicella superfundia]
MSELVVFALRIAFLVLLWLFILFVANIIRTDMWGKAVPVDTGDAAERRSFPPPDAPAGAATPAPAAGRAGGRKRPRYLTMDNGPLASRTFTLTTTLTLGRSVENDIILTDDFASGHHARIEPQSAGVVLTDLGSTNGTFLNDERVAEPRTLRPGDRLRIGRTTMTLGR